MGSFKNDLGVDPDIKTDPTHGIQLVIFGTPWYRLETLKNAMSCINPTHSCQSFSIAGVESMIVPSISNRKPSNDNRCAGAE